MYVFHSDQHMVQSYSKADFYFVLLFPLVDKIASFFCLILDMLVCWCCVCLCVCVCVCVCVYTCVCLFPFTLKASHN